MNFFQINERNSETVPENSAEKKRKKVPACHVNGDGRLDSRLIL